MLEVLRGRRDAVVAFVVFVAGLGWYVWRLGVPSFWRDEIGTEIFAKSGHEKIFDLAEHLMDRVHFVYYESTWAWTKVFGQSEVAYRLPSAIAMAVAAAAVYGITRHYAGVVVSLSAAAIFIALPETLHYGQEARSYGVVVGGVALATFFMHRWAETSRRRWAAAYVVVIAATVAINFFAVLALVPHAVYMLRRIRFRLCVIAWLPSVIVAALTAKWSAAQAGQVAWIGKPTGSQLHDGLVELAGSNNLAILSLVAIVVLGLRLLSHRRELDRAWLFVGLVLPVLLWIASHIHRVFVPRYVVFTTIFLAIALALAAAALWRWLAVVMVIVVILLASGPDAKLRHVDGHLDDFRTPASYLRAQGPHDAIVFDSPVARASMDYYGIPAAGMSDPLSTAPILGSYPLNAPCTADKLKSATRVWEVVLVQSVVATCDHSLHLVETEHFGYVTLNRFDRSR